MADLNEYGKIILEQTQNNIYFSDPETYELVYLNQRLKDLFFIKDDKEYEGQKCYKLLHGKSSPCSFCTNCKLSLEGYYNWYHFNEYLGKYYKINDKLIRTEEGRILRMEIAVDVTEDEVIKQKLDLKAKGERTLVQCIQTLTEISDQKKAIDRLLEMLGEFYDGNRGYIFEFDLEKQTISNTYEWCKEGVTQEIDNLQNLELSIIDNWLKEFEEKGCFCLSSVGKNLDKESMEYKILAAQHIESLIAAPLIENDRIVGFIGVDDPTKNTSHLDLLTSVTYFVLNDIQKRKMLSDLKSLSYVDLLTGIFNRNKYIQDLKKYEGSPAKKMGIAYLDINGLKKLNDEQGHQAGDKLIRYIADSLNETFPALSYRIGGDEFIAICPDIEKEYFEKQIGLLKEKLERKGEAEASLGFVWSQDGMTIQQVIEQADQKMYESKKDYYKKKKQNEK